MLLGAISTSLSVGAGSVGAVARAGAGTGTGTGAGVTSGCDSTGFQLVKRSARCLELSSLEQHLVLHQLETQILVQHLQWLK